MTIADKILSLTKQLYPKGRAFIMPAGSIFERLHTALALSEARAYADAVSTLDSILPDNDNFTADDATAWERRLGLITNDSVPLADRKLAIARKMNHPGVVKARQNYLYLEGQLRAAGFDVYVFENRFPDGFGGYDTQGPLTITGGVGAVETEYGESEYGVSQYGSFYGDIIVNNIDEDKDLFFDVGDNLRSTFFIGGTPLGTFADIDENRKEEFRQLILRVKPVQTTGYLFVNYI